MLFSSIFTTLLASSATASPIEKRQAKYTDLNVLQYALTLEYLEAAYYATALQQFSAQDFKNAGYPDWVRQRVSQISQHETSHSKLLSAALGNNTVQPCTYAFANGAGPLADVKTFVGFSAFLENIGVSAYAGANQYITTPLYSSVAASILAVEARHQGFWSGPVALTNDWTGPYDTPLGLDMVYTLAAQLITSCPAGNPALPLMASTPLLSGGSPVVAAQGGATVPFTYTKSSSSVPGPVNAVVYNGFGAAYLPYTNGAVTLPAGIQGFSYIILTNAADAASVTTANTVAGPAVISSTFGASASNPGFMNPYGA